MGKKSNQGFFEPCWTLIKEEQMEDRRDLRNPQKLGVNYLAARKAGLQLDIAVNLPVTDYAHDESLGEQAAREYRAELEARTDVYAKNALESIDAGKGVEGFDDAG